ncbi:MULTISPECIES: hypothetical protein [unclassified Beijerinckia]|uniref:hypothetical protein n=1 Tax=unclassified Beijerinckia TaxID=2638183 RepID=UPI0008966DFC|nr:MULTISPECIES: hypothetical protein [unclassified Beijerinckia]MDH7799621.1 hypothetical protein [Beijerinckia sp. GAS462]SEB47968.1 hypothetical protein SAMN05443249_0112 [Beijerinckia sp. 28-YEA-48]
MKQSVGHSAFRCDAITPSVDRRHLLLALAALPLLARPVRAADQNSLKIGDLVDAQGNASAHALAANGEHVTLRGYYAPVTTDGRFDLYEGPAAPCQLCGMIHDAGANISIEADAPAEAVMTRLIEVTGRLAAASGEPPRLIAATASIA